MHVDQRQQISSSLNLKPWLIDAADVSLCRRPRVYWFDVAHSQTTMPTDVSTVHTKNVVRATLHGDSPSTTDALLPNVVLSDDFSKFFTFTRPRPRTHP
eukprot:1257262-Amphidinium_carterae.1